MDSNTRSEYYAEEIDTLSHQILDYLAAHKIYNTYDVIHDSIVNSPMVDDAYDEYIVMLAYMMNKITAPARVLTEMLRMTYTQHSDSCCSNDDFIDKLTHGELTSLKNFIYVLKYADANYNDYYEDITIDSMIILNRMINHNQSIDYDLIMRIIDDNNMMTLFNKGKKEKYGAFWFLYDDMSATRQNNIMDIIIDIMNNIDDYVDDENTDITDYSAYASNANILVIITIINAIISVSTGKVLLYPLLLASELLGYYEYDDELKAFMKDWNMNHDDNDDGIISNNTLIKSSMLYNKDEIDETMFMNYVLITCISVMINHELESRNAPLIQVRISDVELYYEYCIVNGYPFEFYYENLKLKHDSK